MTKQQALLPYLPFSYSLRGRAPCSNDRARALHGALVLHRVFTLPPPGSWAALLHKLLTIPVLHGVVLLKRLCYNIGALCFGAGLQGTAARGSLPGPL